MKTFSLITLGCRLNQLESEGIGNSFISAGLEYTTLKDADIFILNSCTVTSKSAQKARRLIRMYAKKGIPCIVTGCYASTNKEEIEAMGDNILAVPSKRKAFLLHLPSLLRSIENVSFDDIKAFYLSQGDDCNPFEFEPAKFLLHSRASVKIQDGCDRSCSYCKVTQARGESVSLESEKVIQRLLFLQKMGYKEITLTGVNIALYNDNEKTLAMLLEKIEENIADDVKIRLSSLEPDLIDDELLNTLSKKYIAPYFHLPIQNVSEKVLRLCHRDYDENRLKDVISSMRKSKDNPFLSADIITGLPGEEDDDFLQTYKFLEDNHFSYIHVFPFSPREGTSAAKMKFPPERIRDERAKKLNMLSDNLLKEYEKQFVNKTVSAILESVEGKNAHFTTDNYLKVLVDSSEVKRDDRKKRFNIVIEGCEESLLIGRLDKNL